MGFPSMKSTLLRLRTRTGFRTERAGSLANPRYLSDMTKEVQVCSSVRRDAVSGRRTDIRRAIQNPHCKQTEKVDSGRYVCGLDPRTRRLLIGKSPGSPLGRFCLSSSPNNAPCFLFGSPCRDSSGGAEAGVTNRDKGRLPSNIQEKPESARDGRVPRDFGRKVAGMLEPDSRLRESAESSISGPVDKPDDADWIFFGLRSFVVRFASSVVELLDRNGIYC